MKKLFSAKFRLFWHAHWVLITTVALVVVSVVLPVWYLAGMEESVRRYIMGINVASLPWMTLNTFIFLIGIYFVQFGGFNRFKKSKIDASEVAVRFSDVIGLNEAKREAMELVQLLKDRAALKKIGGKILRGILMVGPPGCGKTMLAKAIATEAGIPFLSVAGSEFVEIFVGVGASRVRKLFKQARLQAEAYGACIIFIDELEVVGKTRVFFDAFGGGSEGNSTLNQLLVEMDGLVDSDAHVVVIGAMNANEEVLDPALLRPGRFDRKITISRPNLTERQQIFEYYAKNIKLDPSVDLARLARKAVYKTPAEIENLLKEAALIAARNQHESVTYKEVSEAIERIELGAVHRLNMTQHEREMTAYHEAGHLVVLYLTHPTNDVFKASIIQRGGTLGVVHSIPREELYSSDRHTIFGHVKVALAGYVSEKMKYNVTTDGVSADFANAMRQAHNMVWKFGMGANGLVGDFTVIPKDQISDGLKEKLNFETQAVLKAAMAEVESTLKAEWPIVERFVQELLQKEELDYDEIAAIFLEFGKPPKLQTQLSSVPGLTVVDAPPAAQPLPAATAASPESGTPKPDIHPKA